MTRETDEICQACNSPKNTHSSEETQECSKKLVEMGILRFCGICGLTKPAEGFHDRCGKCDEKYTFANE